MNKNKYVVNFNMKPKSSASKEVNYKYKGQLVIKDYITQVLLEHTKKVWQIRVFVQ